METRNNKDRKMNNVKTSRIVGAVLFGTIAFCHVGEILESSGVSTVTIQVIAAYLILYFILYYLAIIHDGEFKVLTFSIKALCIILNMAIFTNSHIESISDFFDAPHFDSRFCLTAILSGVFIFFPEIASEVYMKVHSIVKLSHARVKRKSRTVTVEPGILEDLVIVDETYARGLLLQPPSKHGYSEDRWTISLFRNHLKSTVGVTMTANQLRKKLIELGFVCRKGGIIELREN